MDTPPTADLRARLTLLEQQHTQLREHLAKVEAQRQQLTQTLLRLEGALGVLRELLAAPPETDDGRELAR
jgi:hypothetical protein